MKNIQCGGKPVFIGFQEVRLDHGIAAEHLRCKAYVGPQAALIEGDPWSISMEAGGFQV